MASRFQIEIVDRVALVTIDEPGSSVNTLGTGGIEDFEKLLGDLESRDDLRGVVLLSAKPDTFLAGADLKELGGLREPSEAESWVHRGQILLARWRDLPVPTVAAIAGATLGGGLEVALACTFRVAVHRAATLLGLPEVQLGLIPALGGTFYLPRRVGLDRGLDMLLTGRRLNANQALRVGLVDEVVDAVELRDAALRWCGRRRERRQGSAREWALVGNPLGRALFFEMARRGVRRKTHGHYPAPEKILEALREGYAGGEARALALERRHFGELAVGGVSRHLVGLFLATRELSGAASRTGWKAKSVGVVGAGFMGSGVAALASRKGHRVLLVDQDQAALERGLGFCRERFESLVRRGRWSAEQARDALERIQSSSDAGVLKDADLVVEAVFESLEVKRLVFAELEPILEANTLLASNTSTLPIQRLAEGLRHPEKVLGMHFFSPVHRMPLVELIRHPGTDREMIDRAVEFVASLGKTPIVVNDGPGFYTTRILAPYLAQGAAMLKEGVSIAGVDAAARAAGFPVGPLELLDEVGLDVAAHAARTLAGAFADRMPPSGYLDTLIEAGRTGRKSGKGFYDYSGESKRPDRSVLELLGQRPAGSGPDPGIMRERFLLSMSVEAVRCLEDDVLSEARDGDVGAVLGLGFPPFLGGPFRYLDSIGAAGAIERLERLSREHGKIFEVPQLLRQQSIGGRSFHAGS